MIHSLADGLDVGVDVTIQQLQESREILRVALVRRRDQQEDMVGAIAEQFAESVARSLFGRGRPGHAVRLVNDHEVPTRLSKSGQNVVPFREIKRGDDPVLLQPLVDAELIANITSFEHEEFLVELLSQFPLPLKRQIRRTDNEDSFHQTAQLEFAHAGAPSHHHQYCEL